MADLETLQEPLDIDPPPSVESDDPQLDEISELLIEEISIDGMCGVY